MAKEIIRGIERGALAFFAGTLCSRITGVVRDMSMAFFLGSTPSLAAFMVAYRLANLFRRLLGEGPLPSGVIPHFERIRKECPKKGALFFRDVFFSVGLVLLFFLLAGEVGVFLWIHHGGLSLPAQEILYLTGLMMPGVGFICLYGISSALLQCEKKFFLPSVAPVFFNIVWIAGVFLGKGLHPAEAAIWLSVAVVFGFFIQWASLLPMMRRYFLGVISWKELSSCAPFSQEVRHIMKPLVLGIVGVGAAQINSALDALFARVSSLEGPAYLWYAIRIEQLPLALFGIALASALLPPLSRALSLGDSGQFQALLQFAMKRIFSLLFPCSIALFVLACSGVNLLYGRGDFSLEATRQTIYCLWGYGIGLLPSVCVLLLAPAFYAQKDFRTPMRASLVSVACNIFLNYLFVFCFGWGPFSIALATSLAAFGNCYWLIIALKKQGQWNGKDLFLACYKTGLCVLFSGGITLYSGEVFLKDPTWKLLFSQGMPAFSRVFVEQCIQFVSLSFVFVFVFFSLAYVVGLKDVLRAIGIPEVEKR